MVEIVAVAIGVAGGVAGAFGVGVWWAARASVARMPRVLARLGEDELRGLAAETAVLRSDSGAPRP